MKSERGVTLATLAVYIMTIFIALITLATATTYFSHNVKDFNTKTTADLEFDKFNLYFIEEVKKTDNKIDTNSSSDKNIILTKGNKYEFVDNTIILNDSIKIAENITSFKWTLIETEPQIVEIEIIVGEEENETKRKNQYVFSNKKDEDTDSGEYIYGYKNIEVENTNSVVLNNSLGTTIRNLKIYGDSIFGTYIYDINDPNCGKYKVTITVTDKIEGSSKSVDVYLLDNDSVGGEICIDFEKFKVIRSNSWYNHSIGTNYLYTYNGTSELTVDAGEGVTPTKISLSYYCSEEQS